MKKLLLISSIFLSGCAALPNTGPKLSAIEHYPNAQMIPVDSATAHRMLVRLKADQNTALTNNLRALSFPQTGHYGYDHTLVSGDKISVTLVSWSPAADATGNHSISIKWDIQLASNGTVTLPYLTGPIHLAGYSVPNAQDYIAQLYTKRKVFLDPSVQISLDSTDSPHGVLVTGNTGSPKIVPWTPGGMTLAQVLTLSVSGAQLGESQNDLNGSKSATIVTIIRPLVGSIDIPLDEVLKNNISVSEQDKIIITRKPTVQITVAGGGISNGLLDFAQHPSLAQALAQSKGLNPATADAKSVFVFRNTDSPTLYSFAYKTADAQFAAQQFPLMDGDIVYVTEAPVVPLAQAMSFIWPIVSGASLAK